MEFKNEAELQSFVASSLTEAGMPSQREITVPGGRIDVVAEVPGEESIAIEIKPTLTRDALLQAAGQMSLYESAFPDHRLVLAGCLPRSDRGMASAKSTAESIQRERGYEVWFVDEIPLFQSAYYGSSERAQRSPSLNDFDGLEDYAPDYDESYGHFDWLGGLIMCGVILLGLMFCAPKETVEGVAQHSGNPSATQRQQTQPLISVKLRTVKSNTGLHANPHKNSEVKMNLESGQQVVLAGETSGIWMRVSVGDRFGWVNLNDIGG